MNSRPPSSSAASAITPARCGSKTSRLIPCWHDKHVLTCDNDTTDSWEDGWIRQPPAYQESLYPQSTTRRPCPRTTLIVTSQAHPSQGLVTVTKCGSDPDEAVMVVPNEAVIA